MKRIFLIEFMLLETSINRNKKFFRIKNEERGINVNYREKAERMEELYLSPYACKSSQTKGRLEDEIECDVRTAFQRDRDRVIHSKAFRRLKHKTQVYIAPKKDHYRTRLTHTLEVAQIARTMAKALRLNDSLVEAIALAHDLGHTPFGHIGEKVLNSLHSKGFRHYEQSIRVVEFLEPHGHLWGMNLTHEVKDGIRNHTGNLKGETAEAALIKYADRIAYINHDIDDSIRAGILEESDLPKEYTEVLGHSHGERINTLVLDVIRNSEDKAEPTMSQRINQAMMGLRSFLFQEVYDNKNVRTDQPKAEFVLYNLYEYYRKDLKRLPEAHLALYSPKNPYAKDASDEDKICDYIAGMTDGYVVNLFKELFLPKEWNA